MILPPGSTSVSIDIQVVDDSGLPVTGLVAATLPTISYTTERGATTTISLSDLSLMTSAYSSGGVKERTNGYYRLDVPNAAFTSAGRTTIYGEAAGKRVIPVRIEVRNVNANAVQIAGTDATTQHQLVGTTVANPTPADLDVKLASGHGALVQVGDRLKLNGKWRRITAKGTGPSADEITLDDESDLSPATLTYSYVIPWESGRLSNAGLAEDELSVLGALNTHGVSTHSAADVWAVTTRTITGGTVETVTNAVVLPSIPANWITAAGIAAGALNGKGDWATLAAITALALGPGDCALVAPPAVERPESGSVVVPVFARFFGDDGAPVNLGSAPTFTLTNAAGTDRGSMLGSVTNPSTGEYRVDITVSSTATLEQLLLRASFTKDTVVRSMLHTFWLADEVAEKFTAADRAAINAALTTTAFNSTFDAPRLAKIDGAMQANDATVAGIAQGVVDLDDKLGETDTGSIAGDIAAVNTDIDTMLTRVPAVIDVSDLNTFADRYLTMIELDGAGPAYRLTIAALVNAPAGEGGGGGGDATEANQEKLLKITQAH